jgi:hypothetical protein
VELRCGNSPIVSHPMAARRSTAERVPV